MTSGTSKVNETTLGEEDDVTAAGHLEAVDLGLDVLDGFGVLLEPRNVNLNVEVADVLSTWLAHARDQTFPRLYILQTMASFLISLKCLPVMMSRHPVVVTKI